MGIDQATIDEILRRILSISKADRIILYGSAATGNMTPDSDIDLLILEENPVNSREKRVKFRNALRGMGLRFRRSCNGDGAIRRDEGRYRRHSFPCRQIRNHHL